MPSAWRAPLFGQLRSHARAKHSRMGAVEVSSLVAWPLLVGPLQRSENERTQMRPSNKTNVYCQQGSLVTPASQHACGGAARLCHGRTIARRSRFIPKIACVGLRSFHIARKQRKHDEGYPRGPLRHTVVVPWSRTKKYSRRDSNPQSPP